MLQKHRLVVQIHHMSSRQFSANLLIAESNYEAFVGLSRALSMSGKDTSALLPERAYTEVRPENEATSSAEYFKLSSSMRSQPLV